MRKRIIYLIFQPAPSAVVRAEVFKGILQKNNFDVEYAYLFSKRIAKFESTLGNALFKFLLRGLQRIIRYTKVWLLKGKLKMYNGIIILKYVSPGMLSTLKKGINGKTLYDFDDSVWHPTWLGRTNFESIIKSVDFVSCDNQYLKSQADKFNPNTFVLNGPSQIELFDSYVPPAKQDGSDVVVGWIGSPPTLFYVNLIFDVLEEIGSRYPNVCLYLVGTGFENSKIPDFKKIKVKLFPTYNQLEMVKLVKTFDIGLYPLNDDEISLGRGSLKATIYMAGKVPVVCSAFGENCNIIAHGENGLLSRNAEEWITNLEVLIKDATYRKNIGLKGYDYAMKNLNVESCYHQLYSNYLSKI